MERPKAQLVALENARNRIAEDMIGLAHSVMLEFHSTNVIMDEWARLKRKLEPILFEIERIQMAAIQAPSPNKVVG